MFSTSKNDERLSVSDANRASTTVIARGVKVEGDFSSQGDVVIEGDVQGNIGASGALTIGSEAHIRADVRAGEAVIAGEVEGNITIQKRLVLKSTARVTGDVSAQTLSIEEGATVTGKFSIGAKTVHIETPFPSGTRPVRSASGTLASASKGGE